MYTARLGRVVRGTSTHDKNRILKYILVLAGFSSAVFVIMTWLQTQEHSPAWSGPGGVLVEWVQAAAVTSIAAPKPGPCGTPKLCPEGEFSFHIISGAASVVAPRICLQNQMIVGTVKKNSKEGINIAIVNGKTGELVKTDSFNMYDGEIDSLILFLQSIEKGSIVLMASYDDPASKLNKESKKLISELGSSAINVLKFRDNWIFVGGKGGHVQMNFEKHIKSNPDTNKYEGWPEMIEMEGCIPQYL